MVKALISQARDAVTDGKHQYHGPERALTDESVTRYVSCSFFFCLSRHRVKDCINPKIDSEKLFAILLTPQVRLTSCGT